MKIPNSHECNHFGRKLSNINCDFIDISEGYLQIGSENDDLIYFGNNLSKDEKMLRERIKIIIIHESDDLEGGGFSSEIDLEDILKFSALHCKNLYKRVLTENTE